jgi:hypothetical protein
MESKKSFKDAKGREWALRVDGNVICAYEDATGIDLFASLAERGAAGPVPGMKYLLKLLYLASGAEEKGVEEEDFRAAIYGESLEKSWGALTEALYEFFPKLRALGDAVGQLLGDKAGGLADAIGAGRTSTNEPHSQE